MKKMLFASIVLLTATLAEARHCGRSRRCNRRTTCAPVCAPVCPTACPAPCEPPAPRCCKTIMVPQTIQVEQIVEVPAQRIEIPQPCMIERIPQAPIEVRIPQPPIPVPDVIEYKCVPDQIRQIPQPPIIRWQCPSDCTES
jgi:hypothetical protein